MNSTSIFDGSPNKTAISGLYQIQPTGPEISPPFGKDKPSQAKPMPALFWDSPRLVLGDKRFEGRNVRRETLKDGSPHTPHVLGSMLAVQEEFLTSSSTFSETKYDLYIPQSLHLMTSPPREYWPPGRLRLPDHQSSPQSIHVDS